MITKMSHVLIWVKNQQEALEFYRDKLGFEVDTDATMGPGFRWLTMKMKDQPGFEIILMEPNPGMMLDEESAAQLRALIDKGVLGGGVFETKDIHKTCDRLNQLPELSFITVAVPHDCSLGGPLNSTPRAFSSS